MKRKWLSPLILLGLSLLLDILVVCVIKVPGELNFMAGLACGLLGSNRWHSLDLLYTSCKTMNGEIKRWVILDAFSIDRC